MFITIKYVIYNDEHSHVFPAENSTTVDHPVHPAALKLAMRYHIQKMCMSPHCADSLVLYLNSPAMSDGNMLLWDANRDGRVRQKKILFGGGGGGLESIKMAKRVVFYSGYHASFWISALFRKNAQVFSEPESYFFWKPAHYFVIHTHNTQGKCYTLKMSTNLSRRSLQFFFRELCVYVYT